GIDPGAFNSGHLTAAGAGTGGGAGAGSGSLFNGSNAILGLGALSTINGLVQANAIKQAGQNAAKQSDPFGPYPAGYGQEVQSLMANPSSIESDPAYLESVQAVRRAMAKGGYTTSGNEQIALQRNFGDYFTQRSNQLAGLAGANIGPNPGLALQGQ